MAGELELRIIDKETGHPIAARMHLTNARGKPRKPPRSVYWHDHFVVDGKIVLTLPSGTYKFVVERGHEYRDQSGHFVIERDATDNKTIELHRFVDMKKLGWWSGDLQSNRPLRDVPLLMHGDDLSFLGAVSWSDKTNVWKDRKPSELIQRVGSERAFDAMTGHLSMAGGSFQAFGMPSPLTTSTKRPLAIQYAKQARRTAKHLTIAEPTSWELPIWLASGYFDSFNLMSPALQRDSLPKKLPPGKNRDKVLYPDPYGQGRWAQTIYYHILNCGYHLPPAASSGTGVALNPIGYNRIYVNCREKFTVDGWFEGLKQGRAVVTNGPLLIPKVNGQPPGFEIRGYQGEEVELEIALTLHTREKVSYLEIVKNGEPIEEIRLDQWVAAKGKLPKVKFQKSGWMLIRAVTDNASTYRYASTAPYYVNFDDRKRISRRSVEFFVDWLDEWYANQSDRSDESAATRYYKAAHRHWKNLKIIATAD